MWRVKCVKKLAIKISGLCKNLTALFCLIDFVSVDGVSPKLKLKKHEIMIVKKLEKLTMH